MNKRQTNHLPGDHSLALRWSPQWPNLEDGASCYRQVLQMRTPKLKTKQGILTNIKVTIHNQNSGRRPHLHFYNEWSLTWMIAFGRVKEGGNRFLSSSDGKVTVWHWTGRFNWNILIQMAQKFRHTHTQPHTIRHTKLNTHTQTYVHNWTYPHINILIDRNWESQLDRHN